MKRPFSYFLFPYILGVYFRYKFHIITNLLFVGLLSSIILFILSILNKKAFIYSLVLLIFFIGYYNTSSNMIKEDKLQFLYDNRVEYAGIVKEKNIKNSSRSKYILVTDYIRINRNIYHIKEKVLLNVKGEKTFEEGDKIKGIGFVKRPKTNTNPRLFNYRLYLKTQDINLIIYSKDYSIYLLSKNNLNFFEHNAQLIRNKFLNVLDMTLSEENSSIIKSIILGKSSYLDKNILNSFRELGVSHILAVSGLHVGIISAFFLFVFTMLQLDRKLSTLITIILIWSYGYIVQFPPSVLRASIIFTLLMTSNLTLRRYDAINSILFSAFILLIFKPLWIFNIGFQLSFASALSLVLFTERIKLLLNINNRFINVMSPILAVQIGILPLLSYHFNNISLIAIITNLILVPILSISVIGGFILIFVSYININTALFLGTLLDLILDFTRFLINIFNKFPYKTLILPQPSFESIIYYYLAVFIFLGFIRFDLLSMKIKKTFLICTLFTILLTTFYITLQNDVEIEFLDVGQGDCSLVNINNDKFFLIDTGGSLSGEFDIGENILYPYLVKKGIFALDGVFISHFHEDHCEALLKLIEKLKIRNIFISYENMENDIYLDIIKKAAENDIPIKILTRGDKINITKNVSFEVLYPSKGINKNKFENENNLSMVLLLNAYGKKILFTGDIESEVENILSSQNNIDIDVIKVPHHGSNTSSTEEFLRSVKPEYGIISVGINRFGHPSDEVLKRYKKYNIKIYRTDKDGLITIRITPRGYKIYEFVNN
ncbi:DNA internalization-related competence protein ComEC/Rec2 [Caloranaerobacter azorensis]|uniref:DNA internalization-related competence protein ComEC/Rec2 n=1 Tax=Caloranaerobacter azorensis TaxID=116090 RepID=A0A6P1YAX3_9FIRM|nr:DNA internalization-related competence protein ComEC/Rec2 [Caloranaerobacter azorensis]QIB26341.1 DNA internalization-related competence protein ComEC/Rec2 [Caloranaerobacter azorensis]